MIPAGVSGSGLPCGSSEAYCAHPMTTTPTAPEPSLDERIRGCLLGGAIGDALGAPVEFMCWPEIERRFGPDGIRTFSPAYGGIGRITDDTQMSLFTAEGLIRTQHRLIDRGIANVDAVLHRAYLRWLLTQVGDPEEVPSDPDIGEDTSGWLLKQQFLHSERAPGTTCMGALLSGKTGATDNPINDSKGCGGVMRVAPIGLVASDPFDLGCRAAAITHGHPTGWIAAGAFAQIIRDVVHGGAIRDAVDAALGRCRATEGGGEVVRALQAALALADDGTEATPERIELLGGGWVAEEALAISIFCFVSTADPCETLAISVNHSGDSDSTGSIAGNLLGAALGAEWLDSGMLGDLEGRAVVEQVANDLYDAFIASPSIEMDWDRYPPW